MKGTVHELNRSNLHILDTLDLLLEDGTMPQGIEMLLTLSSLIHMPLADFGG